MSSLRLVPPVVTMARTPVYLLSSLHSCEVCRASSRVGTTTSAGGREGGTEGRGGETHTHTHTLNVVEFCVRLLENRDEVGSGLSGAVLGPGKDVAAGQRDGNALLLDGRGSLVAFLKDPHQQVPVEAVVLKLVSFPPCHILQNKRFHNWPHPHTHTHTHTHTLTSVFVRVSFGGSFSWVFQSALNTTTQPVTTHAGRVATRPTHRVDGSAFAFSTAGVAIVLVFCPEVEFS